MSKDLILVVGASGTVGSELVRLLKAEGHEVRATTSQAPKHSGQVRVNLATGEGLSAAFQGVTKAFFLSPPGFADHHKMLSPLIQEAKRRGLKKVVLMTAMGANAVETSPFRRAEIELEKSGLNFTILRPNWFFQNFNTFWIQGILQQGKILLPAKNAKVSFIDARDISAVAAKALTSDIAQNQALDLTGPEAVNHQAVAKAISEVSGKKVEYQEIKPEELKAGLLGGGVPEDYADFLLLILGFLSQGYSERANGNVREILGRDPIGLKKYAHDHQASWA